MQVRPRVSSLLTRMAGGDGATEPPVDAAAAAATSGASSELKAAALDRETEHMTENLDKGSH